MDVEASELVLSVVVAVESSSEEDSHRVTVPVGGVRGGHACSTQPAAERFPNDRRAFVGPPVPGRSRRRPASRARWVPVGPQTSPARVTQMPVVGPAAEAGLADVLRHAPSRGALLGDDAGGRALSDGVRSATARRCSMAAPPRSRPRRCQASLSGRSRPRVKAARGGASSWPASSASDDDGRAALSEAEGPLLRRRRDR